MTAIQGLFEVTEGIYQLRGIESSSMTVIEGDHGVIISDRAVSAEVSRAGLELHRKLRGERPVSGVMCTHSHIDHFGGVLGVVDADTDVPIIAPQGFLALRTWPGTPVLRGDAVADTHRAQRGMRGSRSHAGWGGPMSVVPANPRGRARYWSRWKMSPY